MGVSVILVEDHTFVRQALARMVDAEPDLSVVGQAGTLHAATMLVATAVFDVAVVDVSLPDGNGIDLVRDLRANDARVGIVVLTMHDDDATLLGALDAGASALVLKTAPADEVVMAVRNAAAHPRSFVAEGLAAAVRRQHSAPLLTPREKDVLLLLVEGLSVAGVASRLIMSESTVKTHIAKLYDKLGARNRAGAVISAVRLGLVSTTGENR